MARLAAAQKAGRARALTNARSALKAAGGSEMTGGGGRGRPTASTRAVHASRTAGIRVRRIRLKKIRIRV